MIRIVIPTQKTEEEYKQTVPYQCLLKLEKTNDFFTDYDDKFNRSCDLTIDIVENNTTGLSQVYNRELCREKDNESILVFMHDDLEIHDQFFAEKLTKAHEKYDIVGLAGATTQRYNSNTASAWHLSKINQNDGRGFVQHAIPKGFGNAPFSHINSVFFGPTPAEVSVIDGLFMSVNLKTINDNNVTFDEDFTFHHYDCAFCLRAKQAGLKIGVVPIFVIHHGLGQMDASWQESHKKFIEKYNNVETKI